MSGLTLAVQDSATMLGREIKHSIRLLRLLIVSAVLVPVVMLLLFDYILGGTIGHGLDDAARGARYIDFLVPGILIMAVAGSCGPTAINVTMDMTGGFVDRIRTMAVSRGALLAGHVGGSVLRMLVATAAVNACRRALVRREPAVHPGGGQPARAAQRRAGRQHPVCGSGLVRGDGAGVIPLGPGHIPPRNPVT